MFMWSVGALEMALSRRSGKARGVGVRDPYTGTIGSIRNIARIARIPNRTRNIARIPKHPPPSYTHPFGHARGDSRLSRVFTPRCLHMWGSLRAPGWILNYEEPILNWGVLCVRVLIKGLH